MSRLQSHYEATDSFSAKFKQTITRAGAPPRERRGTVSYKKPGRMRWEFEAPQPETIVSDGTTIYDYDSGLNQVIETPVKQAFKSRLVAAFFLGVGNLERDFDAASVASSPADGLKHVILTPKGGGDAVELGIDPKTSNIITMAVTDSLGNRTAISFSDIKRNSNLRTSLFAFTPPVGADIVSSDPSRQQSSPLRP
jgi:outer membrane lipoprotein carrier protein